MIDIAGRFVKKTKITIEDLIKKYGWVPAKDQQLIEIKTGEYCIIKWIHINNQEKAYIAYAYVKWDNCDYGTYNYLELYKLFKPVDYAPVAQ
jgi:hypothetical protein